MLVDVMVEQKVALKVPLTVVSLVERKAEMSESLMAE